MSEKFQDRDYQAELREAGQLIEYENLLSQARKGMDTLSTKQRERLAKFGYRYLEVEKNGYEAMRVFDALQDFEGLRKTADYYLEVRPDSVDLPTVLRMLEDHEGIRKLLNNGVKKSSDLEYGAAFRPLDGPLFEHEQKFLRQNQTPVATGGINEGVDLVAIRNLSRQYDIAVPIARGGLNQGGIANLWGMPTRIVDIAAHGRKVARGHWINPVAPEDFAGKRVLLFDKDAVTGASVRKTVKMLSPFKPSKIGAYFRGKVLRPGQMGIGTLTAGLPPEVEVFSPHNAPLEKAGDAYIEAHEKLGTLYGRRRLIKNRFIEEAQKLEKLHPELAHAIKGFIPKQLDAFDSLNPYLDGVSQVREQMLSRLNVIYKNIQESLENGFYDFPGTVENSKGILATTQPLPVGFEETLIKARYIQKGEDAAKNRGVENPHYPSNALAAFSAAQKAVRGDFDIVLIVGPEGFAYEPYFEDLGMQTVAVNIPESGENEDRTITLLDNLTQLNNKKVLVVEDDIRTGATLQKLIEHISPHGPSKLGLYLGEPEVFQKLPNIPPDFKETYIAVGTNPEAEGKEFTQFLESKGLKVFKSK